MGLDQYALWTSDSTEEPQEFCYWRKSNHVQNWMQQLYAKKTGIDDPESFNCVDVELTKEDIEQFIHDAINGNMTPVSGFFFGSVDYNPHDPEYLEKDIEFATKALMHILLGRKVLYTSSW